VVVPQPFRRQRRPEIRIALADQRQGIVALGGVNEVVRSTAARPVPDRRRAIRAIPLEQPEDLAPGQPQQVRAALDIDPTVIDLRQNLDTVQLALAHHNPSHARSLCLFPVQARVTLLHCSWMTL